MPSLTQMSALDYLRFDAERELHGRTLGPRALLAYHLAGIDDLDTIYSRQGERSALEGIFELTDHCKRTVDPPLTPDDLDMLPLVGAPVYAQDRDNVADWYAVARRVESGLEAWGKAEYRWRNREPRSVIVTFLRAGHGPVHTRKIVDLALRYGVPPTAYGTDVSAADWASLAEAKVADREALAGYLTAGCVISEAVALATDGVAPGAAYAAEHFAIPRAEWVDRLAGIPAEWVPFGREEKWGDNLRHDPLKHGPLAKGYTLDQLKAYADAGGEWLTMSRSDFESMWYARRAAKIELGPARCDAILAAGLTPDEVKRWAKAGSVATTDDNDPHPLFGGRGGGYHSFHFEEHLPLVVKMHKRGIRPSHVNDYRYCGATTPERIVEAYDLGITPKRVKELRERHGQRGRFGRSKRLTWHDLLHHHRTDEQESPS